MGLEYTNQTLCLTIMNCIVYEPPEAGSKNWKLKLPSYVLKSQNYQNFAALVVYLDFLEVTRKISGEKIHSSRLVLAGGIFQRCLRAQAL